VKDNERLQLKDMIDAYMDLSSLIYQRNQSVINLEQSEKRYKDLSNQLDKKVKDRTAYIERLLKQKDEFIYQLGHDLKTPLNPLLNLIPILQKKNTSSESEQLFDILIRNTEHMNNLVKKTLKLAQLNSPGTKFLFKPVNLIDGLHDIIKKNKFLFESTNISIIQNIDEDILVEVDEIYFIDLIDNLLVNAVKYSPHGGNITIDASCSENMLTLSVLDEGLGMSHKQIEHVFDEFYKADGSRHDADSSGLGLTICKRIVEKHGGHIWIESEGINQGTKVYFTIPLKQNND
jgi:signal transduction histidine kinase